MNTKDIDKALLTPFEKGWVRHVVYRSVTKGKPQGVCDIYYFAPNGRKYRSLNELTKSSALEGKLFAKNFSFLRQPLGVGDSTKEIVRQAVTRIFSIKKKFRSGVYADRSRKRKLAVDGGEQKSIEQSDKTEASEPAAKSPKRCPAIAENSPPTRSRKSELEVENGITNEATADLAVKTPTVCPSQVGEVDQRLLAPFEKGWVRQIVNRTKVGRVSCDVYYVSPAGRKYRSLKDLTNGGGIGGNLSAANFSFVRQPLGVGDPAKEFVRQSGTPQSSGKKVSPRVERTTEEDASETPRNSATTRRGRSSSGSFKVSSKLFQTAGVSDSLLPFATDEISGKRAVSSFSPERRQLGVNDPTKQVVHHAANPLKSALKQKSGRGAKRKRRSTLSWAPSTKDTTASSGHDNVETVETASSDPWSHSLLIIDQDGNEY